MLIRSIVLLIWFLAATLVVSTVPAVQAFSFNTADTAYVRYTPNWLQTGVQRVKFQFRTTKASVLLLSHRVLSGPSILADFGLYVCLKNGELHALHMFKTYEDTITLGRALNSDTWHTVTVYKDPQRATLSVQLDAKLITKSLDGYRRGGALRFLRDESTHSEVILGDNPGPMPFLDVEHFIGCIDEVYFSAGNGPFTVLDVSEKFGVLDGCIDLCRAGDPCQNWGRCVNRYVDKVCDCSGTGFGGKFCTKVEIQTITLRGYEWLTYDIYSDHDRSHRESTKLSLQFKTRFADGTLFYGGDRSPVQNHLAVSLQNGSVVVSVAFGDGEVATYVGTNVNDDRWHNLTISHQEIRVIVQLDDKVSVLHARDDLYYLLLDPRVYFGGGLEEADHVTGLRSKESFVGCLRNVYYDHNNVLEQLSLGVSHAQYHGTRVQYGCETYSQETTSSSARTPNPSQRTPGPANDVETSSYDQRVDTATKPREGRSSSVESSSPIDVVMSFVTNESRLELPVQVRHFIRVKLEFRTLSPTGLLAYTGLKSLNYYEGYLEISLSSGQIKLVYSPVRQTIRQDSYLIYNQKYNDGLWHKLEFQYVDGDMSMAVDGSEKIISSKMPNPEITVDTKFYMGSMPDYQQGGFIGCMRNIAVQDQSFDARKLVSSERALKIELDNCNLTDLCIEKNLCQHGSLCVSEWKTTRCDCTNTGYTGKLCHFPLYLRSCDELYQSGETRSGVWPIDLDGTGPMRYTYVKCDMSVLHNEYEYGVTSIEHNLRADTKVRDAGIWDMKKVISYRNFDADSIEPLSAASLDCEQSISYDCRQAPILPGVNTWMTSLSRVRFSGFGSRESGQCGCADNSSCIDNRLKCNCDIGLNEWKQDGGLWTSKEQIPVHEMYFLQGGVGEASVSLGDYRCWGRADESINAITFGRRGQAVAVPGWTGGDRLEFWFRTLQSSTVLLHASSDQYELSISLVNDNSVVYNFSTNIRAYSLTLTSSRALNTGRWQHCMIEYDRTEARVTMNLVKQWVEFGDNERMAAYPGTMYIGGRTPDPSLVSDGDTSGNVPDTMLGCIGSLYYNDKALDLPSFVRHSLGVKRGCRPGCTPNPCGHGSTCTELWTEYSCICRDPSLLFGENCQIDLNADAVTLYQSDAYLLFTEAYTKRYLRQDITLSFRTYQTKALLFYIYDHLNNFLQLHINSATELILTMNQGARIIERTIPVYPALSSGQWRQLHIIQRRDRIKLRIDGKETVIGVHRLRLGKFTTDPFKETETLRPPREVTTSTAPLANTLLGGYPSNFSSDLPTFHGCMRGLKISNQIFKLGDSINQNGRGVLKDCVGGCDFGPCKNGASCTERWAGQYVCNCTWTTYRGQECADEVGASFGRDTIIVYNMHRELEVTDQFDGAESFSLGFSTNSLILEDHILVFINEAGAGLTKYIALVMKQGKRLVLYLYFGKSVYEVQQSGDFDDGHRHKVVYKRYGRAVTFQVDSSVVKKDMEVGPFAFAPYMFMIGGVVGKDQSYRGILLNMFKNFSGCMSNVEFYKNDVVMEPVRPFDAAFGISGKQDDVMVHGRLVSAKCAPFYIPPQTQTIMTPAPVVSTGFYFPPWDVGVADTVLLSGERSGVDMSEGAVHGASATTIAIAACLIVAMIILSSCIAFALWRYHAKRKWLDLQKEREYEERTKLSSSGPPKPERYIYRGHGSLPPRLGAPGSQFSLFPNRYGSSGGLQYATLPLPPGRRTSPAVSNRSTMERTGLGTSVGASTRSGLYVPHPDPYAYSSMASSTHSVLSERSRLASLEDLTADEMDSPPPVKRRRPRPTGAVFDDSDQVVGEIHDPFAPLMSEDAQEKRARRRTPSSISEVIAEMERLTKSLPTPREGEELNGNSPNTPYSIDSEHDWANDILEKAGGTSKKMDAANMDESWSPDVNHPEPEEGPALKTNRRRQRNHGNHRKHHGHHHHHHSNGLRDDEGSSASSSSGIGHTDNGDDVDDAYHTMESSM